MRLLICGLVSITLSVSQVHAQNVSDQSPASKPIAISIDLKPSVARFAAGAGMGIAATIKNISGDTIHCLLGARRCCHSKVTDTQSPTADHGAATASVLCSR